MEAKFLPNLDMLIHYSISIQVMAYNRVGSYLFRCVMHILSCKSKPVKQSHPSLRKPDTSLLTYFIPAAVPLISMTASGIGRHLLTCTPMTYILIQIISDPRTTTSAAAPILQTKNHLD